LMAADAGIDGMWTDNFSPWDSFGHRPIQIAFGEWSVARFRDHLKKEFSRDQLKSMGVENPNTFDIRKSLIGIAKKWGWDGENLNSPIWKDKRWLEEPLWRAYVIFKRRAGTEALEKYYHAVKDAAREAGKEEFLVAGNDIPGFSLGWSRGTLDMVSTEVTAGWGLARGARGFRLPPFGRYAPFYKLAREHAQSRFVNIWFYRDQFEEELASQTMVSALYYEMLANHALPMFHPGKERVVGTPETNTDFFRFVERVAPLYGDRIPVEEIGLYYSSSSILAQFTPGGILDLNHQSHQFAYWGWATALSELHCLCHPIPEWKLNAETLADLRVLIIPDSEILDPDIVQGVILPWVHDQGGQLLVTSNSGERLGESGNFDLNPKGFSIVPLTGVASAEDASSETFASVGSGQVLYLSKDIGFDFYMANDPVEREGALPRFRECLSKLLPEKTSLSLEFLEGDSPDLGATLYQSKATNRLFLDLNNYGVDLTAAAMKKTSPINVSIHLPESMR
ncbi:MAG: hypothetical protein KC931_21695, partial [Candidatus Omnitrophica bacterium]|nr:hypothetical protein [Candidatus Omnitrophota bacterium]